MKGGAKDAAKKVEATTAVKPGDALTEAEKEAAAKLEKEAEAKSAEGAKSSVVGEGEKATGEKPADALKKALQKKAQEKAPAVSK